MIPRLRVSLLLSISALALLALTGCGSLLELAAAPAGIVGNVEPAVDTSGVNEASSPTLSNPTSHLPAVQPLDAVAALEGTLATIYERVNPAVVHIQHLAGEGSGFVWDTQGHIVTNNHVVAGATQLMVTFADGVVADAVIVGTDPDSDLAVIRADVDPDLLKPVTVAESTDLRVGELAIAIGNPFGQEGTMTVGFISALGRQLDVDNTAYRIPDVIQTDAAINPGNSGGVLLNPEGKVIGVTSAIISPVRASSGIGFAIPSVIVQRVVPALITSGSYAHPYLGISGTDLTSDLAAARGLSADQRGALLVTIVGGGPADRAGLIGGEQNGDIVVAIDGQPVHSIADLIVYLTRYGAAGDTVRLSLLRGVTAMEVDVILGARPE